MQFIQCYKQFVNINKKNIMEITVGEKGTIEVRKVYNEVTLITNDNEKLIIAMRDSGFEFMYQGKMYSAKEGVLKEGL